MRDIFGKLSKTNPRNDAPERDIMIQNYEILLRDKLIAVWKNGNLEVIEPELLPLYLRRVPNADLWLETRAVDSHRAHSRMMKKALRLQERDDLSVALHANGATITDNYWVRPIESTLTFTDIAFTDSMFAKVMSNLALSGRFTSFNYIASHSKSASPELTNIGSFEKCWKFIDGSWWMFKSASPSEAFSEIFISKLCSKLDIPCALYERGEKCVKTKDFTGAGSVTFEPAVSFMGDSDDYEETVSALETLCPSAIPAYVRMLYIDAITANPDRHTYNFGLIRDVATGEITDFAPLFDHNMALISKGYPSIPSKKNLLISLLIDLLNAHPEFKSALPILTEAAIDEALSETPGNVKRGPIKEYLLAVDRIIKENI